MLCIKCIHFFNSLPSQISNVILVVISYYSLYSHISQTNFFLLIIIDIIIVWMKSTYVMDSKNELPTSTQTKESVLNSSGSLLIRKS